MNAPLSPARVRLALFALAVGGFGIGLTEFVAMGLLPNLAEDLLPSVWSVSEERANAQAGWLISAYALGVVVGAPTIAAVAARFPRKQVLLACAAVFTLGTLASALLPTFELVLAARFVAALPHGAYFGIAALVAASLMGPGKRGQGVALVLSGLTIANVIGVPSITFLGQIAGWRVAYVAVALVFALTFLAVSIAVPFQTGDRAATVKRELRIFGRPQVWIALAIGSIGFGGFFAVYTYVSPLVTNVAGLGIEIVPWVLVASGLGMTIGNVIGGRAADRHVMGSLFMSFVVFALAMIGLAFTAQWPVGLFVFVFLVGLGASALSPAIQTRLMDVAGDGQSLAAAINHASLNIGNTLGALLGGVAIAAGFGYLAPTWIGLGLCLVGLGFSVVALIVERRSRSLEMARQVRLDEDAILDRTLS
ncbi:MAG: MFS transporter [Salinibacterium sp.]|nr:MFS transporter [Salinibacterium sp.]